MPGSASPLAVEYFDGSSTRPRPATLRLGEGGRILVEAMSDAGTTVVLREMQRAQIDWPERQRHGARVAHLHGGGALHCSDPAAWDAFAREAGARESWVVLVQQSWRATVAAAVLLAALSAAVVLWGLPAAARALIAFVPAEVDRSVGRAVMDRIDARWLGPSTLPPARQQQIRAALAGALVAAGPAGTGDGMPPPEHVLRFAAARIGPNAFALPGGTIVVTDALVRLLDDRPDVLVGVLAHEIGHVRHRHGMRMVAQFAAIGLLTGIALGDFSGVVAGIPALLGQMAYSRDAEREADAEAVRVLRAAGFDPAAMGTFFERLAAWRRSEEGRRLGAGIELGLALASHPTDAERIAFFREAGRR